MSSTSFKHKGELSKIFVFFFMYVSCYLVKVHFFFIFRFFSRPSFISFLR